MCFAPSVRPSVLWRHTTSASSIWPRSPSPGANKVSHDLCRLPLPQNGALKRRSPPAPAKVAKISPSRFPLCRLIFPRRWIREERKGGRKEASKICRGRGGRARPKRVLRKEGGKSHHHFWRLAGSSGRGRPRGRGSKKGEKEENVMFAAVKRESSQEATEPGGQMVLSHHN